MSKGKPRSLVVIKQGGMKLTLNQKNLATKV
jgi:hypothetical protein